MERGVLVGRRVGLVLLLRRRGPYLVVASALRGRWVVRAFSGRGKRIVRFRRGCLNLRRGERGCAKTERCRAVFLLHLSDCFVVVVA